MKKKIITSIVVIGLIAGATFGIMKLVEKSKNKPTEEKVFVQEVSSVMDTGISSADRYMGVVEAQETKGIDAEGERGVKTIFVEVGDSVKQGDKLFEYDTEEMELKLKQLELELQSIKNNIDTLNKQIAELEKEKNEVPSEERIEYTSQIQNYQAQVNQYNYDASDKQLEIDKQKKSLEDVTVVSPMDGVIKEINDTNSNSSDNDYTDYNSGDSETHFITIQAVGDYRIKATANELNVRSMNKDDKIIIRSRVDSNMTWTGVISEIDLEHPDSSSDDSFYYGSSGTTATKYPFYVKLDNCDDLMLGQHVYVEPDYGQSQQKEGIWIGEYYIMQDETGAYMWVQDSNNKIEKRSVVLGEYDENMMEYQITSGIEETDYIAYPEERIYEGMSTTTNIDEVVYDEEEYDEDMDFSDEEMGIYNDMDFSDEGMEVYDDMEFSDEEMEVYDETDYSVDDMEVYDGVTGISDEDISNLDEDVSDSEEVIDEPADAVIEE